MHMKPRGLKGFTEPQQEIRVLYVLQASETPRVLFSFPDPFSFHLKCITFHSPRRRKKRKTLCERTVVLLGTVQLLNSISSQVPACMSPSYQLQTPHLIHLIHLFYGRPAHIYKGLESKCFKYDREVK